VGAQKLSADEKPRPRWIWPGRAALPRSGRLMRMGRKKLCHTAAWASIHCCAFSRRSSH